MPSDDGVTDSSVTDQPVCDHRLTDSKTQICPSLHPDTCTRTSVSTQDGWSGKTHRFAANVTDLRCNFCDYKGSNVGNLRVHMLKRHEREGSRLYARLSDLFSTRRKVLRHRTSWKKFKCRVCKWTISSKRNLYNHFMLKHREEYISMFKVDPEGTTVTCFICSKKLGGKDKIYQHVKKCHQCDVSGMLHSVDSNEAATDVHRETMATFACSVCRKRLCNSNSLRYHMASRHFYYGSAMNSLAVPVLSRIDVDSLNLSHTAAIENATNRAATISSHVAESEKKPCAVPSPVAVRRGRGRPRKIFVTTSTDADAGTENQSLANKSPSKKVDPIFCLSDDLDPTATAAEQQQLYVCDLCNKQSRNHDAFIVHRSPESRLQGSACVRGLWQMVSADAHVASTREGVAPLARTKHRSRAPVLLRYL